MPSRLLEHLHFVLVHVSVRLSYFSRVIFSQMCLRYFWDQAFFLSPTRFLLEVAKYFYRVLLSILLLNYPKKYERCKEMLFFLAERKDLLTCFVMAASNVILSSEALFADIPLLVSCCPSYFLRNISIFWSSILVNNGLGLPILCQVGNIFVIVSGM